MTWSGQIVRFVQCLHQADIIKNLEIEDLIYVGKGESGFWKILRLHFRFPVSGVGVLVGATVDSSEIPLSNLCIPIDLYICTHETLPNINPVQPPNFDYIKNSHIPKPIFFNHVFFRSISPPKSLWCFKIMVLVFQDHLFCVSRSTEVFATKILAAKTTHLWERL